MGLDRRVGPRLRQISGSMLPALSPQTEQMLVKGLTLVSSDPRKRQTPSGVQPLNSTWLVWGAPNGMWHSVIMKSVSWSRPCYQRCTSADTADIL